MQCNTVMIDCKQNKPVILCKGFVKPRYDILVQTCPGPSTIRRSIGSSDHFMTCKNGKNFILSDLSTISKSQKFKNHPKHLECIAFIEPVCTKIYRTLTLANPAAT